MGTSIATAGCSGDTTNPVAVNSATAYWGLRLNYHAITMATTAPFDTVRLTATPVTVTGTPVPGGGSVVYQASDSHVTVDSTGLVRAYHPTSGTRVIATLRDARQNVTHADTAIIQITDTVPQFRPAGFSIQPMPGDLDSAKDAVDDYGYSINQGMQNLPVYAADVAGDSLCTDWNGCFIPVYFSSSNTTIASIDPTAGVIVPYQVGYVTFYASSLVYGTLLSDSLRFEVGHRINWVRNAVTMQDVQYGPLRPFAPQTQTIGVGGSVGFFGVFGYQVTEQRVDTVDVTFDDPAAITGVVNDSVSAPIVNSAFILTTWQSVFRGTTYWAGGIAIATFPKRGTFTYHSRRLGGGGTIIVSD